MNSTKCLRSYILLAGLHSLLSRAAYWFFPTLQRGIEGPGKDQENSTTAVDDDVWDLPSANIDEVHPQEMPELQVHGELLAEEQPKDDSAWAAFQARQRGDSKRFLQSEPFDRLLVAATALTLAVHVLHIVERIGSDQFERDEHWLRTQSSPAPQSRLDHMLHDSVATQVWNMGCNLMDDCSVWGLVQHRTWRLGGLAFTMLSKSLCGLEQHLFRIWRGFPWKLWSLLSPGSESLEVVAARVLSTPKCLLDSWSSAFLQRYNTVEKLICDDSLAILRALSIQLRNDIVRVECKHASIRRIQRTKASTYFPSLSEVSASHLLQQSRAECTISLASGLRFIL